MNIKKNIIFPLLAAVAMVSCATRQQHAGGSTAVQPQATAQGAHSLESKKENAPFWSSLFTEVCRNSKEENVCISPLSAQLALAMTANGATGETQKEMYDAMRLGREANTAAKSTIERLSDEKHGCEASIANSIWINDKLDVKQEFINTNKEFFNALVTTAPFNRETLNAINSWCSESTKGKIKSAIDEIKKSDRMYLINALYFKGGWQEEFSKSNTKEKPFTREDGSIVNVPMMHQVIKTQHYEDSLIQVTSKHFDAAYTMLLVLPAEGVSIEEATAHLAANYEKILGCTDTYQVTLSMPKFKSDFGAGLKAPLKKLGMQRAFSSNAEFDGISDEPLKIDNIFQKTFIKVDETGAEAAALTVTRVGALAMVRELEKRTMNLNRPFIYLIKDYRQNILFIGKTGNPDK